MKTKCIYILLSGLMFSLAGCSKGLENPPDISNGLSIPRIFVHGHVSNEAGEPLGGICVAIYGVRKEQEPDIETYNYAFTDVEGDYEIVRDRGREKPAEMTVVATDSTGYYMQKVQFVAIEYDAEEYGSVTADFVLTH